MVQETLQVHCQSCDMIPSFRFLRLAMTTQVRYNDMERLCECINITGEDCARASEAVQLVASSVWLKRSCFRAAYQDQRRSRRRPICGVVEPDAIVRKEVWHASSYCHKTKPCRLSRNSPQYLGNASSDIGAPAATINSYDSSLCSRPMLNVSKVRDDRYFHSSRILERWK